MEICRYQHDQGHIQLRHDACEGSEGMAGPRDEEWIDLDEIVATLATIYHLES